jgi:hypothetical protein
VSSHQQQEPERPPQPLNPLTQWVWVAALGRYGPPALANPWNAYEGDYSDDSLVDFGLSIRQDWLDRGNVYLMSHALGCLARGCKDRQLQGLWRHIGSILPADARWAEESSLPE